MTEQNGKWEIFLFTHPDIKPIIMPTDEEPAQYIVFHSQTDGKDTYFTKMGQLTYRKQAFFCKGYFTWELSKTEEHAETIEKEIKRVNGQGQENNLR